MNGAQAALFPLLFIGGFIGLVFWLRRRELVQLRNVFIGGGANDAQISGSDSVTGTLHGVSMRCQLVQGSKNSPGRTIVHASTPPGMPVVEIHLSAQSARDRRLVQKGLEIDIEVGDVRFDSQVVVEAAPAEIARAVLDDHARLRILQLMPCEVDVVAPAVTIRRRGKTTNPDVVGNLLATTAHVVGRLGSVAGELGEQRIAQMGAQGLAGYRGVGAAGASAAFGAPGAGDELANLRAVRSRRINRSRVLGFSVVAVMVAGWMALAFTASSRRSSSTTPHPTTKPSSPVATTAATPTATARAGTFRDTEGRSFYERGGSGAVSYVDPAQAGTLPLAPPNASYGTPAFGLWFDSHFVRVCDGYRDATGLRAVYDGCRPVVCAVDSDCPRPHASSPTVECLHGWCGVRSMPMTVNDSVAACMAGTGPDWHSASQKSLLAKARACSSAPCMPPAECKVP